MNSLSNNGDKHSLIKCELGSIPCMVAYFVAHSFWDVISCFFVQLQGQKNFRVFLQLILLRLIFSLAKNGRKKTID